MRIISILLLIIAFQSCVPSFDSTEKDRLYLKEINDSKIKLEWFFYSTISTTTPDYILLTKKNSDNINIDTICVANNVADLSLNGNEILIGFSGTPQRYTETIKLPETVLGYKVVIDTTQFFDRMKPRKTYQKVND
ncbi:hypothetical protein [Emticicia sp. C21]|uniref:hypothetical protein n=1 Tax=Emticicia sp. C21 TaxID=2302915 RepID=UPI000E3514AC|nr:hypothetical protein [Emticicia sp. C21]RFS13582.1 hypothetical protein D0T08_25905 [Emticicia sp. C21]